mgnify:CR=1 FL=1
MNNKTKEHVVVGAIVSFVFVAYSGGPFVGGALAGYLEGSDLRSGVRVGALAGSVALAASVVLAIGETVLGITPLTLMGILSGDVYTTVQYGIGPLVLVPLVGGGIGAYVRRETDR